MREKSIGFRGPHLQHAGSSLDMNLDVMKPACLCLVLMQGEEPNPLPCDMYRSSVVFEYDSNAAQHARLKSSLMLQIVLVRQKCHVIAKG